MSKVLSICIEEDKLSPGQVKVGNVIAKFTKNAIVKVNPNVVAAYAKWLLALGLKDYCQEYLDWYSRNVNPTELACSPTWYEEECKIITNKFPLTMLTTALLQLSGDGRVTNMRPTPDTARFISSPEMSALVNNTEVRALGKIGSGSLVGAGWPSPNGVGISSQEPHKLTCSVPMDLRPAPTSHLASTSHFPKRSSNCWRIRSRRAAKR